MDILMKILGLLASLAILVILHELGHFFFARIFKTRVEKFYLFFNPWFEIFKFKRGDTEYGIGWLPLGGYVKIAGMIDESLDTKKLEETPQPWEFRSKPAWQRLLIMLGGVLTNFVLALFIYAMILFSYGSKFLPAENAHYGIVCDTALLDIGMQNGDKILKIDTIQIKQLKDVTAHILLDEPTTITVSRNDSNIVLPLPKEFGKQLLEKNALDLVAPRFPAVVDSTIAGMPAAEAGLQKGDSIILINNIPVPSAVELTMILPQLKNTKANITFFRENMKMSVDINVNEEGKIGIYQKDIESFLSFETQRYTFLESFPAGAVMGVSILKKYVRQFKLVFTREGAKHIGGFGAIGSLFPSSWNWEIFWNITAFLSIILAFINVLPIPALDGGHVLFLFYEIITGRKPTDKFLEYAQITGMAILLALVLYANGNDIFRYFLK